MNLLRRFATDATRREAARLQRQTDDISVELEVARRALTVVEAERDELAAVVARNIERVKAESAAAARTRAQHEGESL